MASVEIDRDRKKIVIHGEVSMKDIYSSVKNMLLSLEYLDLPELVEAKTRQKITGLIIRAKGWEFEKRSEEITEKRQFESIAEAMELDK